MIYIGVMCSQKRENKTVLMKFRATPTESEKIGVLAELAGMTLSAYLRMRALCQRRKNKSADSTNRRGGSVE